MIRTWKKIGAGMILCIFMAGCGSQNEVYLETEVSQDTGNVQETEETEAGERLDILDVSGGEQTGSVDLSEVSGEEWRLRQLLHRRRRKMLIRQTVRRENVMSMSAERWQSRRVRVRAWRPHL